MFVSNLRYVGKDVPRAAPGAGTTYRPFNKTGFDARSFE
jgi:hypothetical protein